MELKCSDLGVANCDFVAKGDTPGEIVEQMVKHLRQEHNIHLPDPDEILQPGSVETSMLDFEEDHKDANIVVTRMRQALGIVDSGDEGPSGPAISLGPVPF